MIKSCKNCKNLLFEEGIFAKAFCTNPCKRQWIKPEKNVKFEDDCWEARDE